MSNSVQWVQSKCIEERAIVIKSQEWENSVPEFEINRGSNKTYRWD